MIVQKRSPTQSKGEYIIKRGNRYRAKIYKNGKTISLGTHDTHEECQKIIDNYKINNII